MRGVPAAALVPSFRPSSRCAISHRTRRCQPKKDRLTDRPTHRPTDRPTDRCVRAAGLDGSQRDRSVRVPRRHGAAGLLPRVEARQRGDRQRRGAFFFGTARALGAGPRPGGRHRMRHGASTHKTDCLPTCAPSSPPCRRKRKKTRRQRATMVVPPRRSDQELATDACVQDKEEDAGGALSSGLAVVCAWNLDEAPSAVASHGLVDRPCGAAALLPRGQECSRQDAHGPTQPKALDLDLPA